MSPRQKQRVSRETFDPTRQTRPQPGLELVQFRGPSKQNEHETEPSRSTNPSRRSTARPNYPKWDNKTTANGVTTTAAYSNIKVHGDGFNINGSVGDWQGGTWDSIDIEGGGVCINGGINGGTGVKVIEAVSTHFQQRSGGEKKHKRHSKHGTKDDDVAGCCNVM